MFDLLFDKELKNYKRVFFLIVKKLRKFFYIYIILLGYFEEE